MATLFVTHHDCIEHDTGPGHPESADRLRVIQRVFEAEEFMFLHREEAPLADIDLIKAVHDPAYVDKVMATIPETGIRSLDGDTYVSAKSGKAALRAAGGACVAVDAVVDGHESNAFVATRPPGIMRNMTGQWGSVCSTMRRLPPITHGNAMGLNALR